jgi:hypothetical protein
MGMGKSQTTGLLESAEPSGGACYGAEGAGGASPSGLDQFFGQSTPNGSLDWCYHPGVAGRLRWQFMYKMLKGKYLSIRAAAGTHRAAHRIDKVFGLGNNQLNGKRMRRFVL